MKKPKFIPPFGDIPNERQKMPELPVGERPGNFREVELGFTEEMALKEAARCLSCRRCIGCGLCLAECDAEAVIYEEAARDVALEADGVIFTSDGTVYNPAGKPELGYARSADVITSLEFERLASPTGPFGGYILRPFDGERPRRIAFIQCVGSREEGIGANFCSVVCCSRTFSQARKAKDQIGEVKVTVFHKGLRPIGNRSELDLAELEAAGWMDFIEAPVSAVEESPETGVVTVSYAPEGEATRAEFDLVVLAVGTHSAPQFRRHARMAGLKTNKYGFVGVGLADLVKGTDGVTFAGAITGPASDAASIAAAICAAGRSLTGANGSERERAELGAAKPAVFVCEYGLELAGCSADPSKALESQGISPDGSYAFLCYKDGRRAMAQSAAKKGRVVVVGCHRASHEALFETVLGLPPGGVAIVGIDELRGGSEGGIADLAGQSSAQPARAVPKVRTVAVIGSGTSGLAASSELLRRGVEVVLIEESGKVGEAFKDAFKDSGGEAEVAETFIQSVESNPNAKIMASSRVTSFECDGGRFSLEVAGQGGKTAVEAGAVLVATGAGKYRPDDGLYGKHDAVIDQWQFAARIAEGKTEANKVVIVQCVGARDEEHPYCSRYCCKQAISNALLYKNAHPEAEVTILHKGIRVFGPEEDLYTDALEKGVRFIAVSGGPVVADGKGLKVNFAREAGGDITLDADLVVLSLAHMHGSSHQNLSRVLGARLDDLGFFAGGGSVLAPFRTSADGVFVCGFARRALMPEEAFIEGVGAAQSICKELMG